MVRIPGFHCHGPGSIPGRGTEIPQAVQCGQKKSTKIDFLLTVHICQRLAIGLFQDAATIRNVTSCCNKELWRLSHWQLNSPTQN